MANKAGSSAKRVKKVGSNLKVPDPGFIPYACHFDNHTVLTKNGELMQVIKITGFSKQSIGSENLDLREILREALTKCMKQNTAAWIHTVRRKTSLEPGGEYPDSFSKRLNDVWAKKHGLRETYVNELYISVLISGSNFKIRDPKTLLSTFVFSMVRKKHLGQLENALPELTSVTDDLLEILKPFGAHKLRVHRGRSGQYYSEILRFLVKIFNLAEEPVPLPATDISEQINTHRIIFGYNSLEVLGETGKHFAALFTIKEYHEMDLSALDHFLQIPQQFIITQCFDFVNAKRTIKEYEHQHKLLVLSEDEDMKEACGVEHIINADSKGSTDFCEQQIIVALINDDLTSLEEDIRNALRTLDDLGVVCIRHDVRLEECFWAQLPGNFSYVNLKRTLDLKHVGGFASLYNFPCGKRYDNHWGEAVTTIFTDSKTPYFFNFHTGEIGHTAILGPFGAGKTVLMNFLVSECQKYNGRTFLFDQENASKVFVKGIGGKYIDLEKEQKTQTPFNPFSIEDSPSGRNFLKYWLYLLASAKATRVVKSGEGKVTKQESMQLAKAVDAIYTLPFEKRTLSNIASLFTGVLAEKMAPWHGEGAYAYLFDHPPKKDPLWDENVLAFDMTHITKNADVLAAILSYLFYEITARLDGRPTIIVLDEAWSLVNNSVFAPRLEQWLHNLTQENAMVIFATENVKDTFKSEITTKITKSIATQIFLPNNMAENHINSYQKVWQLAPEEFDMLKAMKADRRQFMIRQADATIVARLDLSGLPELDILSGGEQTIQVMEEAINEAGSDEPRKWIGLFYQKMKRYQIKTL